MDKKKAIILSSVGGLILVVAISLTVWFNLPDEPEISTSTESSSFSETGSTIIETEATTESTTETTTEKETKPPAAPVTKVYKPKPTAPPPKPTSPEKVVKLNVPMVSQLPQYPTGCEAASATMLLKYYGYSVTLDEMVGAIPREDLYTENGRVYGPSIYEKFVGDPRQTYTDPRPGYGAFSPVITRSLNDVIRKKNGNHTAKNITGCSFNTLLKHLDNGDPVIVWATANMKTPQYVNSWYIKGADGKDVYFEYPRGTHVMVLAGYDGKYVYIADPYFGYVKFTYGAFNDKWNLLGKQAIILKKGAETTTEEPTTVPETTTEEETTFTETTTATETTTVTETETTTESFT